MHDYHIKNKHERSVRYKSSTNTRVFKPTYFSLGPSLLVAHLRLLRKQVLGAKDASQTRSVSYWRKTICLRPMWLQMQVIVTVQFIRNLWLEALFHGTHGTADDVAKLNVQSVLFLLPFSSSSSLCQHKRRRHDPAETGRKHICEQCGKGFYTRDNLKVTEYFKSPPSHLIALDTR